MGTRMRRVDWLVLAYVAVASVAVIIRLRTEPGTLVALLTGHLLIAMLVVTLARVPLGKTGRIIREIYPLMLLLALYSELDIINSGRAVHDGLVQQWELWLFGGQPSRDWWRHAPSSAWSVILHGAYLSYYAIVAIPPFVLALDGKIEGLRRYVFTVMLAFVICYCFFLFFPVAGPYYTFPRPTGTFVDNVTARAVYSALAQGSSYGAAFPSSHVAATIAAFLASWQASRRLGLVLAMPACLLTVAVVYCQMHYAVDAVAGILVGVAAAWVGMVTRAVPVS